MLEVISIMDGQIDITSAIHIIDKAESGMCDKGILKIISIYFWNVFPLVNRWKYLFQQIFCCFYKILFYTILKKYC